MTRNEAYKEDPEMAMLTDFLVQHEVKLKQLHKKFQKDTGDKIKFLSFVTFVYEQAQDLVLNPENN